MPVCVLDVLRHEWDDELDDLVLNRVGNELKAHGSGAGQVPVISILRVLAYR